MIKHREIHILKATNNNKCKIHFKIYIYINEREENEALRQKAFLKPASSKGSCFGASIVQLKK